MQHNLLICDPFAGTRPNTNVASQVAKLAAGLGIEAVELDYVPRSPLVLWNTPIVNPGQSASIYFVAPERAGDYPIVCTLPGHAMRMRSVLHVGPGEAPPPPTIEEHVMPKSGVERAQQPMRKYWQMMDLTPVFSGVISMQASVAELTGDNVTLETPTHKGIAVRTGKSNNAAILFDTDLLRYSVGWSGEFIKLREGREDERAEYRASVPGKAMFYTKPSPGWDQPDDWKDQRARQLGPLAPESAKYRGHYRLGQQVVFSYSVKDMRVLDSPGSFELANPTRDAVITRTIQCSAAESSHRMTILAAPSEQPAKQQTIAGVNVLQYELDDGECVAIAVVSNHDAAIELSTRASRCELLVERHDADVRARVYLWRGNRADITHFATQVAADRDECDPSAALSDLKQLTRGGSPMWDETVITRGEVDKSTTPFAVDTLRLPFDNPWNCLLYTSGLDFFRNGVAAPCTSHGDVWIVSNIDDQLTRLVWRRVASGLANPLGLKIVDDTIYVTCLDQIARLHDLNGDHEIDYYECFNNDCQVSHQHHRFATGLETDSAGNFYYCKCTEEGATDHGGSVVRVSRDGRKFDIVATGLRNPNGLSVGPDNTITFGKQQGGWIPSSGLHTVKPGGFYGYMPAHHRDTPPERFEDPLCWIPHGIDNSCGGQAWVPSGSKWNELDGQLLHFSYGKCEMFLVLRDTADGLSQGGVVKIPNVAFQSGSMRGRFRPQDGQLYVTGLRGWQTTAGWAGCLQRVRYQGPNSYLPVGLKTRPDGMEIRFSTKLDPERANDKTGYRIRQWNYQWTSTYGSKDYSVKNPEEQGRDDVAIESARLMPDVQTVFLQFGVAPVMQMMIEYDLESLDGQPIAGPIFNTINQVPEVGR